MNSLWRKLSLPGSVDIDRTCQNAVAGSTNIFRRFTGQGKSETTLRNLVGIIISHNSNIRANEFIKLAIIYGNEDVRKS
jgi:hypothetical protein